MSFTSTRLTQYATTLRREVKKHRTLPINLYLQKNVRRREVLLSRISVYIVVLMVSCHTVRIIPNIWEILQTLNIDTEDNVGSSRGRQVMFSTCFCRTSPGPLGWTW